MPPIANKNLLLSSSRYINQKEYWVNRLAGSLTTTKLLDDHLTTGRFARRSIEKTERITKVDINISGDLFALLMKFSKNTDLSLYLLLLSTLETLIWHYTGNEDITVISPLYKENMSSATLNNYLLIRQQDVGTLTYKDLLISIRQSIFDAYENQDYPLEDLIEFLYNSGQISNINIRPQVECVLENIHDCDEARYKDIQNRLVFSFQHGESAISGHILYDRDIYDEFYIQQASNHFVGILECVLEDVNVKIQEILFLSAAEKEQIVNGFNQTDADFIKDKLLCCSFEEQVEAGSDGIAVVFEDLQLSFGCFNQEANQMACKLQEIGVTANSIVAIMADRSVEMILGIFGILKAGGAYLPIDHDYPANRIGFMLEDSGATVMVAHRELVEEKNFDHDFHYLYLDHCGSTAADPGGCAAPEIDVEPEDLVYVIYTSGSTGRPKGVMIEQRNVVDLIQWFGKRYQVGPGTNVLQLTNYNFDTSVEDIFGALLHGGTLHVPPEEIITNPELFRQYVNEKQIYMVNYIPTFLKGLFHDGEGSDGNDKLASLQVVISGGEPLDETLRGRLLDLGYRLYNNYGPTELTTDALSGLCSSDGPVTLGTPVANCRGYILGKQNRLLPIGVPGELYFSGNGLARGYLNSPGFTRDKFFPHPFIKGERLYATGDLAMWLPNGEVMFLGRVDHQVKIRGYRIELDEIENRLLAHPRISETVVIASGEQAGGQSPIAAEEKYICAYFISGCAIEISELREHIVQELPDYMIPSFFMRIDQIPLDPNGKIDRKALPAPKLESSEEYEAPRNSIEKKLVKIWADVLGIDNDAPGNFMKIGINANFFHLGGHSLKATVLAAKIHKAFDVKLQLAQIFKYPTIRELNDVIGAAAFKDRHARIVPAEEKKYYHLSSAQKRMYTVQQLDLDSIAYNIHGVFQLEGVFDQERLTETFKTLIRTHDVFRTSFDMPDREPVQHIHPHLDFEIEHINVSPENLDAIIKSFVRPFDLQCPPLLRVGLLEVNSGAENLLIVDMHHIISDGISVDVLIRDFVTVYSGNQLPVKTLQYKDYAQWQHQEIKSENHRHQREFWKKELAGQLPVLNFPTDYQRPESRRFDGDSVGLVLGESLTEALKQLAFKEGTTMYMVLLAVFYILLQKLTRQQDIIVGTPIAGRRHTDLEQIIGIFVNTLVLRNFPGGEKTYSQFLNEVKERTLAAFENQDCAFEDVVEMVVSEREMSRNPLFDAMFDFQSGAGGFRDGSEEINSNLKLKLRKFESKTSKVDFNLLGYQQGGKICLFLEYSTALFKTETMENFLSHYEKIAGIIAGDAQIKIKNIQLIEETQGSELRMKIQDDIQQIELDKEEDFDI